MESLISGPKHTPKLNFYRWQLLSAIAFLLITTLALLGFFDTQNTVTRRVIGPFEVVISYPEVLRHREVASISVEVRNVTDSLISNVQLTFDETYMDKFSNLDAIQAFESLYTINLNSLKPQQRSKARIQIRANEYGSHHGYLILQFENKFDSRLRFAWQTAILP